MDGEIVVVENSADADAGTVVEVVAVVAADEIVGAEISSELYAVAEESVVVAEIVVVVVVAAAAEGS